jgi:hypothetical protein
MKDRNEVASRLVGIAEMLAGDAVVATPKRTTLGLLRDAREGLLIASDIQGKTRTAAAPRVQIDKMPGFSPMQLRQAIDQVVSIRQEAQQVRVQYESVLKKLSGLDDKEKKGVAALKTAAGQIKQKERFLVEAENGLLEFTAFVQEKRPGVEQMLADPTSSKFGDKAGDFFGRVGATLGKEVQEAVAAIYEETKEDLTHTADAIRGLKVVAKTASVKTASLKKAGLADMVVSFKDWLAGQAPDGYIKRILNFAGDVKKWIKGFTTRTSIVRKNKDGLLKALKDATTAVDTALS